MMYLNDFLQANSLSNVAPGPPGIDELYLGKAREEFRKAIRRRSMLILDNLGIHVKMKELSVYPLYNYCRKQKFGTHRISRLWCQHICTRLFPLWQSRVDQAYEIALRYREKEFVDEVFKQAQKWGYVREDEKEDILGLWFRSIDQNPK